MTDICQSCALPFQSENQHGTNGDDGKFIDENFSVDDMVNYCSKFMDDVNKVMPKPLTREEFVQNLKTTLPNLKRWKN
ncbi:hypothetical protein PIROE2DRAFT_10409 [Piromyces sp. E2]|nr:hypothetical protein PIROE2DRAFT_10409 [Piromyces sp. E2]|eukprot:OUM63103.1 hypothetical protein PIROE2DRAFT_10409 [Piromyces sp. E2]